MLGQYALVCKIVGSENLTNIFIYRRRLRYIAARGGFTAGGAGMNQCKCCENYVVYVSV